MFRRGKKLPKTIQVANETWRIERPKKLQYQGRDCYGFCEADEATIYIVAHLGDGERAWQTLMHEFCHAFLFVTGIVRMLEVQIKDDAVRDYVEDQLIDGGILPIAWNLRDCFVRIRD